MNTSLSIPRKHFALQLGAVMLSFFVMGFVDLVGTASNYIQKDYSLTDAQANILPSLVFFWFLIFSVPTSLLMNRIGRKPTVMASLTVTLLALLIPILGDSYNVMFLAFSLLGIGNAILQTSLNPLVSNLISDDKLASVLTFGQFVKAISSFLAPIIAAFGATYFINEFNLGWKFLFVIYSAICILSIAVLNFTPINEASHDKVSSVSNCLKLLKSPFILLCFIGIMCHVGIDVGTNTIAPKLLMERLSLPLEKAGFAISLYFIFRTAGCFIGGFLLQRVSMKYFLIVSVLIMASGMSLLLGAVTPTVLYAGIAMIGLGNSNIFPVVFSQALNSTHTEKNEVSGLMIMGLFGGTVFPIAMGLASDAMHGQAGAVAVLLVGAIYLLIFGTKIKK